jgi:hypothetical protein
MPVKGLVFLAELPPEELDVLVAIAGEVRRARAIYGALRSMQEGRLAITDADHELWAETTKGDTERDDRLVREKALQIAATAARFVLDLLPPARKVRS